jgi:hypothetical protein
MTAAVGEQLDALGECAVEDAAGEFEEKLLGVEEMD